MTTEFGRMLRIIRVNHNDSLRTMARKIGYSPAHLSSMENGKRTVPIDIIERVSSCYSLSDSDIDKLMQSILSPDRKTNENLTDFAESKDGDVSFCELRHPMKNQHADFPLTALPFGAGNVAVPDESKKTFFYVGANGMFTLSQTDGVSPRRAKKIRRESADLVRSACASLLRQYAKQHSDARWGEEDRMAFERELFDFVRAQSRWKKLCVTVETLTVGGFCLRSGLGPKPTLISGAICRRWGLAVLSLLVIFLTACLFSLLPKPGIPTLQLVWKDEEITWGFGSGSCFWVDLLADGEPIRNMKKVSVFVEDESLGVARKLTNCQLLFLPKAEGATPIEIRYRGAVLNRYWYCHAPTRSKDSSLLSLYFGDEIIDDAIVFHDTITLSLRYNGDQMGDIKNVFSGIEDNKMATVTRNEDGSFTVHALREGMTYITFGYRDEFITRVLFTNLFPD